MARREAVSRARCSTWALVGADGAEIVGARGFAAWNAALPVRFALAAGAGATKVSKRAVPVEGAVQGPAKRPRLEPARAVLAPYAGHALATGAGFRACLRCGEAWGWSVRPGVVCMRRADELPALVRQLLEVGALDVSLAAGSEGLRLLAAGWGWADQAVRAVRCRPPARARAPAPPD